MYAAASSHSEPVQLLLAAGANPNHKSPFGDTPLMASATSGSFDDDLFRAGADVNAQDSVGVTSLMIPASKAESEDIRDALKAEADAFLKDAAGRSALDYLRLANCGKSPIRARQMFDTGEQCDHLDKEDVQSVTALLKTAKRKAKTIAPCSGLRRILPPYYAPTSAQRAQICPRGWYQKHVRL